MVRKEQCFESGSQHKWDGALLSQDSVFETVVEEACYMANRARLVVKTEHIVHA